MRYELPMKPSLDHCARGVWVAELCLETSDTRIQVLSHTAICRYPNESCPSAVGRKNPTHHYCLGDLKVGGRTEVGKREPVVLELLVVAEVIFLSLMAFCERRLIRSLVQGRPAQGIIRPFQHPAFGIAVRHIVGRSECIRGHSQARGAMTNPNGWLVVVFHAPFGVVPT